MILSTLFVFPNIFFQAFCQTKGSFIKRINDVELHLILIYLFRYIEISLYKFLKKKNPI